MSGAADKAPDCAGRNGAHTGDDPDTSPPWRIVWEPNGSGNRLPTWAVYGPYNCVIAVPGHRAHNFANAHLIAAAPELLEACRQASDMIAIMLDECGRVHGPALEAMNALDAAIAKAEGRTNA